MWPASVCGQPAWVAATQPGPRRRASTAGVTQPGGLGRPNQAGSPSPSVLPGPGNPGRPGWPAPPNQGGRAAQPVCSGHPAPSRQAYGRLAGRPGPPGQPGLLSLAACSQQRPAAIAVEGARKTPEDGARAGAQSLPQPAALEEEPSGLRRPPAPPKEEVRIHVPPATSVCPLPASQTPSPRRSTRASSRSRTSAPTGPSPPRRPRACRGCRAAGRRC